MRIASTRAASTAATDRCLDWRAGEQEEGHPDELDAVELVDRQIAR